jgi:Reverse transcriptase (RNA-dependent DNA polymerase)
MKSRENEDFSNAQSISLKPLNSSINSKVTIGSNGSAFKPYSKLDKQMNMEFALFSEIMPMKNVFKVDGKFQFDRNVFILNNDFIFNTALSFLSENSDPSSVPECKLLTDWPLWKDAIAAELNSLLKRGVFGEPVSVPADSTLVGCRWIFTKKRGPDGKIIRYKARLVAQGFSQPPGFDFNETYSHVMDLTDT